MGIFPKLGVKHVKINKYLQPPPSKCIPTNMMCICVICVIHLTLPPRSSRVPGSSVSNRLDLRSFGGRLGFNSRPLLRETNGQISPWYTALPLPETNMVPENNTSRKRRFLLETIIFRCYICFRECIFRGTFWGGGVGWRAMISSTQVPLTLPTLKKKQHETFLQTIPT